MLAVATTNEEAEMSTADENEALIQFRERYAAGPTEATRAVERAVIGDDWGANGYTTRAEADRLGRLLELRPGRRLLDVGSGRGWPGLYLAGVTGSDVVLADLPIEGLRLARERAEHEGLRPAAVVASASALPFRPASFHAIVHTDVLC